MVSWADLPLGRAWPKPQQFGKKLRDEGSWLWPITSCVACCFPSHFVSLTKWKYGVKSQSVTRRGHSEAAYLASKASVHWKPGYTCSLWTTIDLILRGLKRAWSLWPAGHWFKTQTDFVNDQKWFPPDCCLCLNKINRKVSLQLLAAHSLTATFQRSTARFSAAALHLWEEQNLHALQARDMLGSPHPSSLQLSAATAMTYFPGTSLISTVEVWNLSL